MQTKNILNNLKISLSRLLGRRVYFNSLETAFKKIEGIDFTPKEKEALILLSQQINQESFRKKK